MFSHDDIWGAIDRLARFRNSSPSGLARQAGLDPTAFNKSKRRSNSGKPRWPSTESLSKVLTTIGMSFEDFAQLASGSAPDDITKSGSRQFRLSVWPKRARTGFLMMQVFPSAQAGKIYARPACKAKIFTR